jgi:hypothetical protein
MSNTVISFKKGHFTLETTKEFQKDFDEVCKTMDSELFIKLFIKYDFYYDEGYREVLDLIIHQTSNWYNPDLGTELLEVTTFDSNCVFCFYGKAVTGYKWTYINRLDKGINNRIAYSSKIAFIFEYDNNNLIAFGVCNSFVD